MRSPSIIACVLSCAVVAPAIAAPPPSREQLLGIDPARLHVALADRLVLGFAGSLEATLGHVDAMALGLVGDGAPDALPAETSLWMRARLSPVLGLLAPGAGPFAVYRLAADVDILRSWLAVGDGRDALAADPRGRTETGSFGALLSQLYLQAGGPELGVQVGLVRSRWGLGLVSNAGDDPVAGDVASPYGLPLQGDQVARVAVAATPLGPGKLTAALSVDGVIDDDTASWSAGDRAYQVVAAVSGKVGIFSGGLYFGHRWQTHHEGGDTAVNVFDGTLRLVLAEEEGLLAFLEAEVATIRGSSSLAQSPTHPGSFDVDQLGGVARFAVRAEPFLAVLEVGVASADENPFDDELRGFSFDRDYRVGLLLFHELLRADAAASAHNVAAPTYRSEPPRGYQRIATLGAVRGASYANPRVDLALLGGDLHLMAGFLYGASDGEYVDPFWSGLAGGAPRGPRNGSPARDLGWEVDLGASWVTRVTMAARAVPLGLRFRLEGAFCRPGRVFDDAAGRAAPDVLGIWGHAGVLW